MSLSIFEDFPHSRQTSQMTLLKILTLASTLLLSSTNTDYPLESSTLTLSIQNINKATGNIMIAVSKGEENFLEDDKAVASKIALVEKTGSLTVSFPNLPYGEYSVAVYHDVNGNQKLDTNFFGVPTEPYGFSNNARSKWGPPKYETARFQLNQLEKSMVIDVKKWSKQ